MYRRIQQAAYVQQRIEWIIRRKQNEHQQNKESKNFRNTNLPKKRPSDSSTVKDKSFARHTIVDDDQTTRQEGEASGNFASLLAEKHTTRVKKKIIKIIISVHILEKTHATTT